MQTFVRGLKVARGPRTAAGAGAKSVLTMGGRQSRHQASSATAVHKLDNKQAYEKLCEKLKELNALNGISGLLGWDEMVMMPPGAAESRGAQKAALAGVVYDKKTDPELGALLEKLAPLVATALPPPAAIPGPTPSSETTSASAETTAASFEFDAVAAAVVRDARKEYVRTTAIPKELAQRIAKLESEAYAAWVEARKASDFSKFAPFLQQWVDVNREKARLIDPNARPYDVLLDDYEKGMTQARLDEVFKQVRAGLVPLIASIKSKGAAIDDSWIKGDYNTDKQAELCKQVALDLGFSTHNGRLDVSVHPFTGGTHPTDVRMTTRFKQDDLLEGLTGAIHETGHALYEQGRNLKYDGLPVNSAMSMGIHESQSLLWERQVALSKAFSAYLLPKLKEAFPSSTFADVSKSSADLYAAFNTIRSPSLIRVEADEVTYPMHIILRYEIEVALMEGTLKVENVPATWNTKMKELLGEDVPSDAQGCLQDVHWSAGLFGYFPTYSLGAMYATQIFDAAKRDMPSLEEDIAAGKFAALKDWLNAKIHRVGSLYSSGDELMKAATGAPLDPSIFLKYLGDKYTELYKL